MRKQIQHIPQKGMNKDLSISKFTPEFTYDNYNVRLNSNEDSSLFTITNEKGNIKTSFSIRELLYLNFVEGTEFTSIPNSVIDHSSGAVQPYTDAAKVMSIDCTNSYVLKIIVTHTFNYVGGAFYDKDGNYISGFLYDKTIPIGEFQTIQVPDNAVNMKVAYPTTSGTLDWKYFYCVETEDEDNYDTTSIGTHITSTIRGTVIGYSVINGYLVLFTTTRNTTTELIGNNTPTSGIDRIYRLNKSDLFNGETNFDLEALLLFEGENNNSLNFSKESLLETLPIFESNEIQKIYWVDKYNQPRFINIVSDKIGTFTNNSFNFSPYLNLHESVNIERNVSGGQFHSGVIQYAFTYWNRNGIETNIFHVTPLYYISFMDRAGSAEEICSNTFNIQLYNLDKQFDYLRVYSIHRTSLDSTPSVRIVSDINLTGKYYDTNILDNGIIGSTFDVNALSFIGGDELLIGTITHKDNTLFCGNIKLKTPSVEAIQEKLLSTPLTITIGTRTRDLNLWAEGWEGREVSDVYNYYPYSLRYPSSYIKHWKYGETYRIGIQAQYKNGKWSDPVWSGKDIYINQSYTMETLYNMGSDAGILINYPYLNVSIPDTISKDFIALGYIRIRPIYVPLSMSNRSVISQGFVTNTIAKIGSRQENSPFAWPDYFTRCNREFTQLHQEGGNLLSGNGYLNPMITTSFTPLTIANSNVTIPNSMNAILHRDQPGFPLRYTGSASGYREIQGGYSFGKDDKNIPWTIIGNSLGDYDNQQNTWFIDKNLLNFWSPEVEHDVLNTDLETISRIRYRGIANITSSKISHTDRMSNDASNGANISFNGQNAYADWKIENIDVGSEWIHWSDKKWSDNYDWKYKRGSKFATSYYNFMLTTPFINYINKPKIVRRDDSTITYKSSNRDGKGTLVYRNNVDEVSAVDVEKGVAVQYKSNNHLLFNLIDDPTKSSPIDPILPEFIQGDASYQTNDRMSLWYRRDNDSINKAFSTQYISASSRLGKTYTEMISQVDNRHGKGQKSGYPYLWVVDLIRDVTNQYGGYLIENIVNNQWVPCGDKTYLNSKGNSLLATEGDTYIQRYDCLRITPRSSDLDSQWQRYTDGVSVWVESFINLDGRYDSHRYNTILTNVSFENYQINNHVYSQLNNLFNWNALNYSLLQSDSMPTTFLWSNPKIYSESIDSWTSLWMNNSYTVDGSLGKINALLNFNNELYGFQDKGIFQILFNSRVQVPTSDNNPIELTQSWKTQGIRYVSNTIGTTNKWSIKQSNKNLYFINSLNKDIYLLGTPPINISEQFGFKTWSFNNILNLYEYNLTENKKAFITNLDIINDNLYFNNEDYSLMFSERLNQFESFYSYEDIAYMFNIWGEFLSIKDNDNKTTVWVNHKGKYNEFFGEKKKSHIEFYINPDMPHDKVFDNFQYRADLFDDDNNYIPRETFTTVDVSNEFQNNSKTLMTTTPGFGAKKFRIWSYPFPRQSNSLNRIRNPWVKLRFNLENDKYRKLLFHDLIITYTI